MRRLLLSGALFALLFTTAFSGRASAAGTPRMHSAERTIPYVSPQCNQRYALLSYKAGLFVSARANLPGDPLQAVGRTPGGWELFTVRCIPGIANGIALLSYKTNLWVYVNPGDPNFSLQANGMIDPTQRNNEVFIWGTTRNSSYDSLQSNSAVDGMSYVSVRANLKNNPLEAVGASPGGWEWFDFVPA